MIFRILFLIFIVIPVTAFGHSPVAYVLPQDGSVIKKAPDEMEIVFTGPSKLIKLTLQKFASNEKKSFIGSLLTDEGETVALSGDYLMKENKRHLIALPPLDEGTYQTNWRALSEDGHTIKGEFSFEVSPEGIDFVSAESASLKGEGQIKRIRGSKVTIKHGAIGDLMPAMTMEYSVPDKQTLASLKKGDNVLFTLNKDLEIIDLTSQ